MIRDLTQNEVIEFRNVKEDDWADIGWLASNAVQEADHSSIDSNWTERRRAFSGTRHHSIAESDGQVIGYCAMERTADDSENSFRIFLIADWNPDNRVIHEALFDHVEQMILGTKTDIVWMRELAGDTKLIKFLQSKGFETSEPYTIGNLEMVNLHRRYSYDS